MKTNLYSFLSECCPGRNRDRFMPQGFSLVHVLLIIFLIVLVVSIILPSIPDRHKSYAYVVKQRYQFKSIETALELFKSEFNGYPSSSALDENGKPYCGAMKLGEAMMGQDLMGFHPDSVFRSDGTDGKGTLLYPDANNLPKEAYSRNRSVRKVRYLPLENANAYCLKDLYKNVDSFDGNDYVICDIFRRVKHIRTGKKIGMPILYYKANTSKTAHDVNDPNNPDNIYNYRDNHALLALEVPGKPGQKHPLYENPKIFYEITLNTKISGSSRPYRAGTYILLSAGQDGLYGTKDDIANFDFRWRRE